MSATLTRFTSAQAFGLISISQFHDDGSADVWVPCTCGILPLRNVHDPDTGDLIKVSDSLACTECSDTGWHHSHCLIPAGPASHHAPTSPIAA